MDACGVGLTGLRNLHPEGDDAGFASRCVLRTTTARKRSLRLRGRGPAKRSLASCPPPRGALGPALQRRDGRQAPRIWAFRLAARRRSWTLSRWSA